MQFKNKAFFALFVNATAAGDIRRYNSGMSFVLLQSEEYLSDFTLQVIAVK